LEPCDTFSMESAEPVQTSLSLATWLWLLVPMLACVASSILTYVRAAMKRR